jgi:2,4-dienoyl-CoA reductase-like NADH-dependent reductase (Old Yellow Enzyme family)
MTRYQNVFSPFKFANVEVKNRIEVSPMLCCMATPDGYITRELIEFYQTIARGGAGIVTVGDVVIDTEYAPGHMGQMSVGDDRIVGGLSTLVESIQKYGAKASIELNHAGRRASPRVLRVRILSALPPFGLPGKKLEPRRKEGNEPRCKP